MLHNKLALQIMQYIHQAFLKHLIVLSTHTEHDNVILTHT